MLLANSHHPLTPFSLNYYSNHNTRTKDSYFGLALDKKKGGCWLLINNELTERYARWLKMTEVVTTIQQENQDSVRY